MLDFEDLVISYQSHIFPATFREVSIVTFDIYM